MELNILEFIVHLVFWLFGFFFLFRIYYCKKSKNSAISRQNTSVIIPARNEENTLPFLLASLKKQEPAPGEIIVVDDNSEDNTAGIARDFGATVIKADIPPAGWRGKTWACHQGAIVAKNKILVFLDADTILEENGLEKIMDTSAESGAVISVQPYHRMKKVYEQFSAFFNIILMAAMGSFTILGNRIKSIGLFGPVMVIPGKLYAATGGHMSVKDKVVEDLEMGMELKQAGIPIRCYGGRNSIAFRMYPEGMSQMVHGWAKGFASGATKTSIPVLIIIVMWIVGAIGAFRYVLSFSVAQDSMQIIVWGALYLCYVLQIYWMLYRIGNFAFYTALFYPAPLAFFILIFAYSGVQIFLLRKVEWKGRKIDISSGDHKP
jgi:4,4'-diaponeurosporenoate glycosyltransferase